MEHKMMLMSPCLSKVHAVVRVPVDRAGVAQVAEQRIRIPQGEVSSTSTSPTFLEVLEKWTRFRELGRQRE